MECPPDWLIASEGKGDVGYTTADLASWAPLLNLCGGIDEVHSIVVVLCHAGADSENVGIKDDILWIETHLLYQDLVGTGADTDLIFSSGSL